jgi:hypothetical protein
MPPRGLTDSQYSLWKARLGFELMKIEGAALPEFTRKAPQNP